MAMYKTVPHHCSCVCIDMYVRVNESQAVFSAATSTRSTERVSLPLPSLSL